MKQTQQSIMAMNLKSGPTPEQRAEIARVVARFDKDWMIDPRTKQIRRKKRSWVQFFRDWILPRRHSVFSMYWWLKDQFHKQHREAYMPFEFPIEHDNMPIPGYPMKYEIIGDWSIPKKDLRYLSRGPLARIAPKQILVSHEMGIQRIFSLIKVFAIPLGLTASLLTVVVRLIELSQF